MLKLKIPPAAVFLMFAGTAWLTQRYIPDHTLNFFLHKDLAIGIFITGAVIGLLAVVECVKFSTTVNPHKPENSKELVTTGVYQFSRNPMYLGLLIVLIAMILYWGNSIPLLLLPGFIWYMNEFQIKPEEEVMEQKFGDVYLEYKEAIRRWI